MIQNYLKLSLRNLLKHPLFTGLNVFGLALGLAVSLLLFLHVRQEWLFDRYHSKAERIYRATVNAFWDPAQPEVLSNAPNAVGPAMKEAIPGVEQYARLLKHEFGRTAFIQAAERRLTEDRLFWADPGFFNVFDVKPVSGDLHRALSQPNTAAISRSTAIRYFGTEQVLGQTIRVDQMNPLEIKAVFEDFPGHSSLDPKLLGSFQTMKWANNRLVWSNSSFETWILLRPEAKRADVEPQLAALLDKNVAKEDQRFSLWLQPLREVHLFSSYMRSNYCDRLGDPKQVSILGVLALAVLLIACFNYMNLSTARAQLRFREVGINKTMGASGAQMALRFYAEAAILTLLAAALSLLLLSIGIPFFNRLADKQLSVSMLAEPATGLWALGILTAVVLIAGSYPAFFLSGFSPKNLLQTSFRKNTGAGWFRRSLVITQFAASVVLIVGTLVLHEQMKFIQQKKLGFEPEQVVAITTIAAESRDQVNALIQSFQQLSTVKSICRAQAFPGQSVSIRSLIKDAHDMEGAELLTNHVSPGFEKVLGMTLVSGATLPPKQPDDTLVQVVLNETAVKYLGSTPEQIIGQKVQCNLGDNAYVVGVVQDFHAQSLHQPITAYAFHNAETETRRYLLAKLDTRDIQQSMAQLESAFKQVMPHSAFQYQFVDDYLQKMYQTEVRTAAVFNVFSLLSILVSCLGLFGLAAFAAEQRVKEIGIRKVLGASIMGITGLLARDFLKWVLLAVIIASPIAWYLTDRWLSDFAFRIELQWWWFALAGAVALTVALLTVSFQSIRAALENPVKSLGRE
ncbi:MAG TPA: cell division protein FtsX [Saprospirales bacterium]|nr:cell division protein FtsX [Saprospirales bacterium]